MLAHRGASGSMPEHTVASYSAAFHEGADFIELDLQMTKDGYLVCNHDPTLIATTNIKDYTDKYESRRGNFSFPYPYEAQFDNDFLINDFTLAEL